MNERTTLKINDEGHLEIGGIDALKIKEQYGTPLYVMDEQYIEDMCNIYSATLKNRTTARGIPQAVLN